MKKKKYYFWGVLILFQCLLLTAQTKFDKLIWFNNLPAYVAKDNAHFYVNAIEYNKAYYVFGFNTGRIQTSNCNDSYDGWNVFKLDSNGNLLRALRIGGPIDGERMFGPVIQTRDKGFLISGHSTSFSYTQRCDSFDMDCNFLKLDSNLNFQWLKSVGGRKSEILVKCYELKNGGYMAFGATNSFGYGGNDSLLKDIFDNGDIYIMKLSSNGQLLGSITYGTKYADIILDVEKDEGDNFYIIGRYQENDTSSNPIGTRVLPFVMKVDSNLNVLWSHYYYITPITPLDPLKTASIFGSIKLLKNNVLYLTQYHPKPGSNSYFQKILRIDPNTGNIIPANNNWYLFPSEVPGAAGPDEKILVYNNNLYVQWWSFYTYIAYLSRIIGVFDTSLYLLKMSHIPRPLKEVCMYSIGPGSLINHPFIDSHSDFLLGSTAILDTMNFTKNYLYLTKMTPDFETCYPDTGSIPEDTATISYIPVATGSITSINQGIVLSWTPTIVEGAKDSTLCFCPGIPMQTQVTPVNCFSNGAATLTPLQNGNYTYQWTPSVSSTNTASNLTAGTYTVIVSDSTGCWHRELITIPVQMSFPLTVSGSTALCSGESGTISVRGGESYSWSTGDTSSVIVVQPSVTTNYTLTAAAGSCTQTVVYTISVTATPTVVASPLSGTISSGDTIEITLSGAGSYSIVSGGNYLWIDTNKVLLYPRETEIYCIEGENLGCVDSSCVRVVVDGSCMDVEVPNVFTPNGDGVNEWWKVNWRCSELVEGFKVEVFDRWGVLVYVSEDKFFRWDGRCKGGKVLGDGDRCVSGTYYYVMSWEVHKKKVERKGYITLLR
ncbi:MAG: hypothetical protein KatS3mg027_0590 [Bacteroidia bacterium]|nr:MAG: hypothetical protein KatS3mg027_0590 [Bacteroidia bacterium]